MELSNLLFSSKAQQRSSLTIWGWGCFCVCVTGNLRILTRAHIICMWSLWDVQYYLLIDHTHPLEDILCFWISNTDGASHVQCGMFLCVFSSDSQPAVPPSLNKEGETTFTVRSENMLEGFQTMVACNYFSFFPLSLCPFVSPHTQRQWGATDVWESKISLLFY